MDFQEKFGPLLKTYSIPLGLAVAGLMFLGYGVMGFSAGNQESQDIVFEEASSTGSTEEEEKIEEIAVDVEGAVEKPGVYMLKKDARIQDALIKAGGMSEEADRGNVAKSMNLAAKLTDGAKIYIPFTGEKAPVQSGNTLGSISDPADQSGLINVNSATESELDTLPGVGPVTAGKIIGNRPYEKIEDLVTKKAVGSATFEKIRDQISVF